MQLFSELIVSLSLSLAHRPSKRWISIPSSIAPAKRPRSSSVSEKQIRSRPLDTIIVPRKRSFHTRLVFFSEDVAT
jgi:hypothetical protein